MSAVACACSGWCPDEAGPWAQDIGFLRCACGHSRYQHSNFDDTCNGNRYEANR